MIELYDKGTTSFSTHGIALQASEASVTYEQNGRYELDVTMPYDSRVEIDYGMVLRSPVPKQHVDEITLGTVSYWQVNTNDTKLYKSVPVTNTINYKAWVYGQEYNQGDKCTYKSKNYQARIAITGISTTASPDVMPNAWQEISRTKTSGGEVAATLNSGATVIKIADFNTTYMQATDTNGHEGFIEIAKCTDMSQTETRTVPAFDISKQAFIVTEVKKSSDKKTVKVHATHISYNLGRVMLEDCNVNQANPATTLMFIRGAMKESYGGKIETNLSNDYTITQDFSWKNAQNAILDPASGLLKSTNATLIRNNQNVYILETEEEDTPRYRISYGSNMKSVIWDGKVDSIITRVYPTAQTSGGDTLLLPEEYIDTVREVPFIKPEALKTGLKVGAKQTQADGSEVELTESMVYDQMRQKARDRFNIDEVDKAEVTLEVDWQHLPDTAEYADYAALRNAAPGEWVLVVSGPLGISMGIQLTGYTFDAITERYTKGTFGKKKTSNSVASYQIKDGAVTNRTLGRGAVNGENLQAKTITAREIEAGSITADKIASKQISAEQIQANSITADEIAAGAITADKIRANSITADKIAAGAITADKIAAGAITADKIQAGAITADKIQAGAITADKIAAGAITADKIAAGSITADKIAANAITAEKIKAGEITAEKIAAGAITADKIAAGAITAGKIDAGAVTAETIQAGSITADKIAAGAITADKIAAGAITAEKIDAGAITTVKLAAGSVTADKIGAGEVTAGKIAAGSIDASKINTGDISAINATLGTASIADARIAAADIGYAQVKDLTAGSAYFGQAVIQAGVANKLFIPRLSVDYAQVVSATIGDLVIQASNDNYYKLDVDLSGNVTATQVTPTAEEIAAGHTSDGRTIYTATEITASDLNTTNIYASHALMDEITANVINTDQLFAREATISKINAMDLSSNTYIQATIGNWQSGSTITQTIQSISSRVSELGYGTIYYSATEPAHTGLVQGDIWVQPLDDHVWGEYDEATWQDILDGGTWGSIMGAYKVYTWSGQYWKTLFDSTVNEEMWTAIEQNAAAIALKASQSEVNLLSGQVSDFDAILTVQAQQINAAVSAVNTKASSYYMWADPNTVYTVTLGDIWIKGQEDFGSWGETANSTWGDLKTNYKWKDALGSATYVWDGNEWIQTADRATEIYQQTQIDQTATKISLLAETTANLGNETIRLRSELTVANDRITAEVERATTADNSFSQKTRFLMTSGMITLDAFSSGVSGTALGVVTKAGISVDGSGKITLSALESNVQANINKAASISMSGGKILISALENDAQTAINKSASISMSNGKILISSLETNAQTAISKAADISMSNGKILLSSLETNVQDSINKAASISMSGGKILISSLETDAVNAINKAAGIEVYNGKVKLSAAYFDQLGATGSDIVITPTKITVKADKIQITSTKFSLATNGAVTASDMTINGGSISIKNGNGVVTFSVSSTGKLTAKNAEITGSTFAGELQAATGTFAGTLSAAEGTFSGTLSGADGSFSGTITATSGTIGGFTIASTYLRSGSGQSRVELNTGSGDYAIWCGSNDAANAPFRLKRNGTVALTKLLAIGENNTETEVNLRTAGLWKLNYSTVKQGTIQTSGGYCTAFTLSDGTTVNFKPAASARADGWSAAHEQVRWPSAGTTQYFKFRAPSGSESDTPKYQEKEYTIKRDTSDNRFIVVTDNINNYARYQAYSKSPTWTHSMVTATVMSVSCTVDGYTYTTQFSI